MPNIIQLNKGSQHDFVETPARHSAYIGGIGAGKTFALCVRALKFASQPKIPGEDPPKGCLLSISVPVLKDNVIPVMEKVFDLTGVKATYKVTDRKFIITKTGAEILLRGLDEPNRIRGMTIAYFGIDEGRNFKDGEAYNIMVGRLRQGIAFDKNGDEIEEYIPGRNYNHGGWVCSTPNGYDWMWRMFNEHSPGRIPGTEWYSAASGDNRYLPKKYLRDLEARYVGRFYEQEVLGRFVGVISGAVFDTFEPDEHVKQVPLRDDLPLYSFWDFGIGDACVCIFAQLDWLDKPMWDGSTEQQPVLRLVGSFELTDSTVARVAEEYWRWLDANCPGREPVASWGDPAGLQRNLVTGTSVLRALAVDHGIRVKPAPKRPIDEGIYVIQNLMMDHRFMIDGGLERMAQAIQTYRWKVNEDGVRLADKPVHDWTSHYCDALRYGALGLIGISRRRTPRQQEKFDAGSIGYVMERLHEQGLENIEMGADGPSPINWMGQEQIGLKGLI